MPALACICARLSFLRSCVGAKLGASRLRRQPAFSAGLSDSWLCRQLLREPALSTAGSAMGKRARSTAGSVAGSGKHSSPAKPIAIDTGNANLDGMPSRRVQPVLPKGDESQRKICTFACGCGSTDRDPVNPDVALRWAYPDGSGNNCYYCERVWQTELSHSWASRGAYHKDR